MGSFITDNQIADNNKRHNVVITGFGPFRNIAINPSWQAIKDPIVIDRPVNVVIHEVAVAYDTVDDLIPKLWSIHDPLLMVHVGVAAQQTKLRIESCARPGPYLKVDVNNCLPTNHHPPQRSAPTKVSQASDKYEPLVTCLRLDKVISKLSKAKQCGQVNIDPERSYDAGLYVCEYIYHKSLSQNSNAAFIHIPNVSESISLNDIKKALKLAIELMIDDLMETHAIKSIEI